ncbi:MAG: Do family serine endopeptidase [Rhizobiales bacterium]|jgi:serine protease Do|nr:Do family serine endopeptidase [Hyphomicrobiales bacterium]
MNPATPSNPRVLPVRRLALLATTIAGLAVGGALVAPSLSPYTPALAQNLSQEARHLAQPTGFADIVEKVKPSVISVRVKMRTDTHISSDDDLPFPKGSPMERFFRRFGLPDDVPHAQRGRQFGTAQGSGFLISADGYAVTNNHVVEKATTVEVSTDDGKTHSAKVIGTDPRTDLALIKIDGGNFPYVKLADAPPRVGDWVLAVGNPFGLGGTVTAGIVSARGRDIGAGPYDDFLQIDAPVNKGNSGGPTFNTEGSVIGVNTAIYSPSGGSVGIAFAIPAETVKSVVAQLKDKGSVTRGWIGVQIQPVTPEIADSLGLKKASGALVAEPQKNSPALKAGIEAGDVIATVDGKPVNDARDLARTIGGMAPGTTIKLGIVRDGAEKAISLTLGELPNVREARALDTPGRRSNRSDDPRLGLSLAPAGGSEPGVVVADVDPSGPAADFGFKAGDVILEVAGKAVATPDELRTELGKARSAGKHSVLMRVKSEQGTRYVAIPLGRA